MTQPNPFLDWVERYDGEEGIILFAREIGGIDPDEKQSAILRDVARRERRIAVRSGHGVGKSTTAAIAATWHLAVKFPQKTVCTAPTKGQLFDALAAEIKSIINRFPEPIKALFEVKVERIELRSAPSESFIAFNTSRADTPEAMAGVHSANVLLIPDEASGIPEAVYEASSGSMSGHNAVTLLAGNPVRTSGLFFDAFHKLAAKWKLHHISCVGHPRVADDFVEDIAARYGRDSNAFRVRVLGEFPKGDDDTVIPYELAASALHRDVKPQLVQPVWGVDCARFGSDASALARRRGNVLEKPVEIKQGYDTMQVAGWVKSEWDRAMPSERPTDINIDVIGIGAGVVDRLIELGLPARGINVSEKPAVFTDFYANLRAELWFKGKAFLDRMDCTLNGDDRLVAELVGPRYKYASTGKMQVESKDDMKKRGVKSPNCADAFLLTLATDAITAQNGSSSANGRSAWGAPLKRNVGIV